jgi:hypothetical protein
MVEFGIITAPKWFPLPDSAYDMSILQNTDGGVDMSLVDRCVKRHFRDNNDNDSEDYSEDDFDEE